MSSVDNQVKICFYARAGQLELFVSIAKRLMSKNINCIFVTQNKNETSYVDKNISNAKIYEIETFLSEHWDIQSNYDVKNLGIDISDLNIWRMLYTDRFLVNYSTEDCKRMIYLHFLFFNELFHKERPKYFINESVAIFAAYVALEVGKIYDCKYVGFIIARDNPKEQFFFVEDLIQRNKEMYFHYFNSCFLDDEIKQAREYLLRFRDSKPKPAYMHKQGKIPKFSWKMPFYPLKYLLERKDKRFTNKVSYMEYKNAFNIINGPLLNYLRYLKSVNYYQKPVDDEKFYLFPLHYQPEASTLVCAQKYEKQLFAIDNIAKSLPNNTLLYVKEHYAVLGHRSLHFYKELQKYPNVRLIDPFEDIHALIKNSLACIVLTNTTGFEAILHGKKVFVLGDVFYDFFENVEKISDVYIENEKLLDYNSNVKDEDIVRFLCAYKRSLYDGCVYSLFDEFLDDSNINKLIQSFEKYITKNKM